ncbi:S1/P1 nuclease [Sphingomonas sp. ID1715]|uniref:S1/P1 nuclease n=1 Tax=Sphingomonas sp. ID1715 TaxID=1656898 RepID=UPI0014889217|nr:S1/P1 nuclease [Sphingomonas sp. ID1715]NNM77504.1 S1/P1 nuclease [Sphingomonas sp. ID1715]
MRYVLALMLALAPTSARAWWDYGHKTVAAIAWAEVKPATRAKLRTLLARSALLETPMCPARTLEEASVWADCVKPGERFSYAFPWHFQNIDICRPFELKAACLYGNCVSAQVSRNAKLLADKSLPVRERVQAMAFLVHFVGDLHQPLHAADRGDQGGSRTDATYGIVPIKNLHLVWDGYLAERAISTPAAEAKGLLSEARPMDRARLASGTVEDWSRESWDAARRIAYGVGAGDPCAERGGRVVLDDDQIRAAIPEVRAMILRAGLRLAHMLDVAFS